MDFESREDSDGVRLSWNFLPKSKLQHERNVVPFGAMYTPLNNKSPVVIAEKEEMISCRQCRTFINPYVELNNDIWCCSVCGFSNRVNLAQGLPVGLQAENSTVEYKTGRFSNLPPIFLYVVDTCFEGDDVEDAYKSLKDSLTVSLSLLPQNALVGFISFGKHVQVHDLSSNTNLTYTYNGSKEHTLEEIQKSLGLLSHDLRTQGNEQDSIKRVLGQIGSKFLQPVNIAEYQLSNLIENLVTNTFPHSNMKERSGRATGAAVNIASLLLRSIFGDKTSVGGHVLCFIGGVCTFGPGKVVGNLLKEPMRSHHDIVKSRQTQIPTVNLQSTTKTDLTLFKNAEKFYSRLAESFVSVGVSCNLFIGCYDQIGLFEMEELCSKTGGNVVLSDSFSTSIFKQSFLKFFRKQNEEDSEYLDMGFSTTLECRTSSDLQIQGLIGNAVSLPVRKEDPLINKFISKTSIAEGDTNYWKLCNVNPQSTYAIYFEKFDSVLSYATIQFLFHYQHSSGEMRLRVTTISISIIPDTDGANLEYGFDQEAALVLAARKFIKQLEPGASFKAKLTYDPSNIGKQLEKFLVEFCTRFAVYVKGSLESFSLSSTYAMIPQFLYHLKRSSLINVFNNSPDETSFIRHVFMHEDITNSLIIIQPTLLSYDVDTFGAEDENGIPNVEPEPVLLDSLSLGPTKILLLDTFFHILIYHGSTVAAWRKAGYHEMEGYEHFKEFLEAPKKEAMEILMDRFPLPRFIDCDEGGSQARFLVAKLNPSTTYVTNPNRAIVGNSDILTDDISLQIFMDRVKRLVIETK